MSLSDQKLTGFSKKIMQLADQPNMQPQELKAYFDSSPEELRQAHNGLCDALCASDAAAGLGFARSAGVPADTVQAAVENVQQQVRDAVVGNIPSGSVDGDKLAQDVRDRFAAIESAAANEASTRASADSQMQSLLSTHTTQIATKCEVYVGTYTGDGAESRTIPLTFTPKALLLFNQSGQVHDADKGISHVCGGLCMPDYPIICANEDTTQYMVSIVSNGFQVGTNNYFPFYNETNVTNRVYYYIAFK